MKCCKLIGSKRMITKNIGNIILIIFLIVYIYSLISYIIRGVNPLKDRLIEEMQIEEDEEEKVFNEETKIKSRKNNDKVKIRRKVIKRKVIKKKKRKI